MSNMWLIQFFLLNKHEYIKMIEEEKKLVCKNYEKFMLVYAVGKDTLLSETVSILANSLGLKVISIGGFSNKCKSDKFDRTASPGDFISLISNADFVVTSSFHCVAFSLIFNKQFAAVLPKKNPIRLENIIKIVGLEKKIIKEEGSINEVLKFINYDEPNKKLNSYIERSKNLLFDAINSENNTEY